jgi:O-antigen ligase
VLLIAWAIEKKQTRVLPLYLLPLLLAGSDKVVATSVAMTGMKALSFALILVALLLLGPSRCPRPVALLLGLFALAFLWSLVHPAALPNNRQVVLALFGLILPWLVFFVPQSLATCRALLATISWLPPLCIALAIALHAAGITPITITEYTGATRLSGPLSPAYLGALGMFGAAAAAYRWLIGERGSLLLLAFSLVVTAGSLTRGPLLVVGVVMVIVGFFGKPPSSVQKAIGRVLTLACIVAAMTVVIPLILERIAHSGSWQGQTSGRQLAWDFFWFEFQRDPWRGRGMGANSLIGGLSSNTIIQDYFAAPHNTYLQLLVDFGWILGVCLIIVLSSALLLPAIRAKGPERLVLVPLVLGLLLYAYNDNLLAAPQPAMLSAAIVWAITGMGHASSPPRAQPSHDPTAATLRLRVAARTTDSLATGEVDPFLARRRSYRVNPIARAIPSLTSSGKRPLHGSSNNPNDP